MKKGSPETGGAFRSGMVGSASGQGLDVDYFPAFAFITMSLKSVKKVRLSVGPAAASG